LHNLLRYYFHFKHVYKYEKSIVFGVKQLIQISDIREIICVNENIKRKKEKGRKKIHLQL